MEKVENLPPEFLEFRRLFNQENFFEAHEALELLWREEKKNPSVRPPENPVDFYHGFIQIAAAFVHIQRGTPEGAKKLLETASHYLAPYPSFYCGVHPLAFLTAAKKCVISKGPFPKF